MYLSKEDHLEPHSKALNRNLALKEESFVGWKYHAFSQLTHCLTPFIKDARLRGDQRDERQFACQFEGS